MTKTTDYNEINLEEWQKYENVCTNTLWNEKINVFEQLLTRYTKSNDNVLIYGIDFDLSKYLNRNIINMDTEKQISLDKNNKIQFIIAKYNVHNPNLINTLKTSYDFLEKNHFFAFICSDIYFDKQYHLYGFEYANNLIQMGFKLRTTIVKEIYQQKEGRTYNLWRYRALEKGFNTINHEYIFIFEKM